jgi:Peroxisomal membrane protein (Pex16)
MSQQAEDEQIMKRNRLPKHCGERPHGVGDNSTLVNYSGDVAMMTKKNRSEVYKILSLATATLSSQTILQNLLLDIWDKYKSFAQNHHIELDMAEDVISRVLFWLPHRSSSSSSSSSIRETTDSQHGSFVKLSSSPSSSYWREVIYGFLSLHRLVLNLALQEQQQQQSSSILRPSTSSSGYGMTVQSLDEPSVPAVGIRIALTVVQSILPSVLAIAEVTIALKSEDENRLGEDDSIHFLQRKVQRTTRMKLYIEQFRFVLRMYLLCNYWKQQQQQQLDNNSRDDKLVQQSSNGNPQSPSSSGRSYRRIVDEVVGYSSLSSSPAFVGIMMDGGVYYADQDSQQSQQQQQGISWDAAEALARREVYVGRRTGWRQSNDNNSQQLDVDTSQEDSPSGSQPMLSLSRMCLPSFIRSRSFQIKVAEFLHVVRPVIWAWCEAQYPLATLDVSSSERSRQDRRRLWQAWILSLGTDIASIQLLETANNNYHHRYRRHSHERSRVNHTNEDYMYEINRRKMALLLYGLRCPMWNIVTSPKLLDGGISAILQRLPLVGGLLDTAVWDWVMYYKWLALEDG